MIFASMDGRKKPGAIRRELATSPAAAAVLALALALATGARASPLSPEQALASFRVGRGLKVELVAAEPLVVAPVAFAFDERGRLYVVEARGYPDSPGKPTYEGRVALLEDSDGDGRYDRRKEFAGGFTHPNGIAVWRGGVFVTCAPGIFYLKDHDGDGVADQRDVVLTGFQTGASSQNYTSHPTLGLDGKFYITSGLRSGGSVRSPLHPERPAVEFSPSDSRFDPDSFAFETTGGRGQFGLAFDAFGRRFVCDNRNPVLQVVLETAHLKRNPHLPFAETMEPVSKVQAEAKVMRISRAAVTADFIPTLMSTPHAGTFTAACGLAVFGGSALPPAYDGNVFVCEPAQNLIQRQTLRPHGASFRSDAVFEGGAEFMASTDVWFRPVFLANGPRGALYIADMYRGEIDHPIFIPEEARGRLDFEAGKGMGRIYRVVGVDSATANERPAFDAPAALLGALESPDAWTRETARRLLIERAESPARSRLPALAKTSSRAETRCAALWLLRSLGGLEPGTIVAALKDRDARVREQGALLAAAYQERMPELRKFLAELATDSNSRVRFLVALGLGAAEDPEKVGALSSIAAADAEDRWTRAAILSGLGSRTTGFAETLLDRSSPQAARTMGPILRDVGRLIGASENVAEGQRLLARARSAKADSPLVIPLALGLVEGASGRQEFKSASGSVLARIVSDGPEAAAERDVLFRSAQSVALDTSAAPQERTNAVALLGYGDFEHTGKPLGELLDVRHPSELRLEAVRALERIGDVRGAELLVRPESWSGYSVPIRTTVVAALSARRGWPDVLFAAVELGTVRLAEISFLQRNFLLKRAEPAVRQKAATLFESKTNDRMEVYRKHLDVLKMEAKPSRGEPVFQRVCVACHSYAAKGGNIGPELTGIRNQPREAILLHTLVPNSEISPDYESVTVTTKNGGNHSGRVLAENENSLTLRTMLGTDESLLRSAIASVHRPGVSLMPDGLEDAMTRQELADLIAFLKQGVD